MSLEATGMPPLQVAAILFSLFGFLVLARIPVAFALGIACVPVFFFDARMTPTLLMYETFKSYNAFVILAVPVLPDGREPHELGRNHRSPDKTFASVGRALSRRPRPHQRGRQHVLRRHLRIVDGPTPRGSVRSSFRR